MVSTRSHPTAFPPPELASPTKASPSKRGGSRATSTASPAPAGSGSGSANAIAPTSAPTTSAAAPISTAFNDATNNKKPARTTTTAATDGGGSGGGSGSGSGSGSPWTHTPSRLTLAWLALSLPLVAWDTGYMLLRPHSMPGGRLHAPLWTPYALYGTVDHVYGFPAWERGDGFGAAQATLNLVETALYLGYAWVVYARGSPGVVGETVQQPAGKEEAAVVVGRTVGGAARVVAGRAAARAVLVAFAASVMTLSKTVLYWLVEYWSGFQNIGHNDAASLFFLWIVPNGAWLVLPTYMMYVFGSEIVQGLEAAGSAGASTKKLQ